MWVFIMLAMFLAVLGSFFYVTRRISQFRFMERVSKGRKWLRILESLVPVLAMFGVLWYTMGMMDALICMIHLVIIWLLCDGVTALLHKKTGKPAKWSRQEVAGLFAIILTAGYLICGWFLANHVWEVPYTLHTEKQTGSLRVVQFADSHVGTTFDGKGLEKYVEEMQQTNPDVVVITGDFVDDDTSKQDMIDACHALSKLNPTYGVYFVFGNHDKGYYSPDYRGYSGDDLVAELEANGVHVLQDENELIDDRIYIVGRQDRSEEAKQGRVDMETLTADLDDSHFSIVMDHQPCDYEAQAASGVDLVVSGHTHGGQMFPLMQFENLMALGGDDKVYGYEKRENTNFIVTSGISDWAIKFKTGCRSEYVLIDIQGEA